MSFRTEHYLAKMAFTDTIELHPVHTGLTPIVVHTRDSPAQTKGGKIC